MRMCILLQAGNSILLRIVLWEIVCGVCCEARLYAVGMHCGEQRILRGQLPSESVQVMLRCMKYKLAFTQK